MWDIAVLNNYICVTNLQVTEYFHVAIMTLSITTANHDTEVFFMIPKFRKGPPKFLKLRQSAKQAYRSFFHDKVTDQFLAPYQFLALRD
jgi:hypothetical protein